MIPNSNISMTPHRHLLLATALLVAAVPSTRAATNPPGGTVSCPTCPESSGGSTGSSSPPSINSLGWSVNVGLGRYAKPASLTDLGQSAYDKGAGEKGGGATSKFGGTEKGATKGANLPTFQEMYGRYFSSDPLQQSPILLELSQPQLSAASFHPSCLFLQSEALIETLKKPAAGGFPEFIHQILTDDAFTLIDLLPAPDSGFRVRVWKRNAAALTKSGGYYVTTNFDTKIPLNDVTFKRPPGSTSDNTLIYSQRETTGLAGTRILTNEIVETLDGNGKSATVTTKLFSGDGTTGPLLSQEDLTFSERGTKAWDYTIVREVRTASVDASGTAGSLTLTGKTREDYDDFSSTAIGGDVGMKRLVSYTEAYDVAGQSPQTTAFTYIQAPTNPTVNGRLQSTVKPDGSWTYWEYSISASSPVSIATEYSGWKDLTLFQRANARKKVTTVSANDSVVEKFVEGQFVGRSKITLTPGTTETVTTSQQWDGSAWHITTTAYYPDSAPAPSTGRIKWIEKSDGTAKTYSYATVSGNLVTTARTGAGSRSGITAGTEVKTTYSLGNIPIAQVTKDITSNLVTEQWDADPTYNGGFDAMGRPIKRIYNADVNDYDISQYACCGLEFSRDRMGATTSYFRDGLKRVYKVETKASAASPAVATFTTENGLTTTRTRRFGSSDALFLGSTTRSLDGLTTIETGPSLKSNLAVDRPVTTTTIDHFTVNGGDLLPSGDTVTTTHADASTSITAKYRDGRISSISGTAVADKSYDYATHTETGGGEKTVTNASGVVTSTFTDLLGRTRKTVSGTTGTTSYAYHALGAAAGSRGKLQSVTDADNVTVSYGYNNKGERTTTSRTIPLASGTATQVTTTTRDVVANATLHGVSLGTSIRQTQTVASTGVSAVTTSRSYSAIVGLVSGSDSFGSQTLDVRTRANATTGIATHATTNPDGAKIVQTFTHGLLTGNETQSTTGSVITGTSYHYDAFQRRDSVTDLRIGATAYSNFTEAGQPLTITTNANTETISVENDIMGRAIKTTLPDTSVKYTAYHPAGQLKAAWGSQTYPTWNVYDEQGRQTQLHTWKTAPTLDPASIPANPPSGSEVTTWIYGLTTDRLDRKQYADAKGTDYTYTAAGRLQTRVWARGITTTYGYTHGLLASIDYSDSTPDVTLTYDPLGRQSSVTQDNQSQIAYTYDPANLALDTETLRYDLDHDGTDDFTRVLDRSRDALRRDHGWQLKDGATIENQATYGYSATDGRLATVVGGEDVSSPQTFTYGYTPNSNLIQTVTGPVHTVTNTWEPTRDVLDIKENKVGTTVVSSFDYAVNSIGQRNAVATSGTAFPALPSWAWGYDSLGQVTSADSSVNTSDRAYQYDAIGNRKKSADSLTLPSSDNYTSNVLNQYTGIQQGGTGVSPVYDDDGNATAYPLPVAPATNSALGWDAENRLISSTVGSTATTYLYDAYSRRMAVTTGGISTLFVYDDWNCIAEYSGTALSKTNLWGLDLSDTLQSAGGVGGLLAERLHSGTAATYHPTYDGNGNVSEYLAANGTTAAHFEYDPIGNTVVDADTSNLFTYRFSTKPRDAETGLYYYGYRYYDPKTGRWPSRDPIEEAGGVNLYGFVRNDAILTVDAFGLRPPDGGDGRKAADMACKTAMAHYNRSNFYRMPSGMPLTGAAANTAGAQLAGLGYYLAIKNAGADANRRAGSLMEKYKSTMQEACNQVTVTYTDPAPDPEPVWCRYDCDILRREDNKCVYDCKLEEGGDRKCDGEINPFRTAAKLDDKGCLFCEETYQTSTVID
jgi:RHS repeat-associated protein